eukprot:1432293-Lingulodinium_polyedra.AAC.1
MRVAHHFHPRRQGTANSALGPMSICIGSGPCPKSRRLSASALAPVRRVGASSASVAGYATASGSGRSAS